MDKSCGASGIDTNTFTSHSCRLAASSKAGVVVPLSKILENVRWSNERIFANHYSHDIV